MYRDKFLQQEQLKMQSGAGSDMAKAATLAQQEDIIKKVEELVKHNKGNAHLWKLAQTLENHPAHRGAIEQFENTLRGSKLTDQQFAKIHETKVGKFIDRYGGGKRLSDTLPSEKGLSSEELAHRRSLASIIEKQYKGRLPDKFRGLTVERLLQEEFVKVKR